MHSAFSLGNGLFTVVLVTFVYSLVAEMNITFESSPYTKYEIFIGWTVNMLCQQEQNGPIDISYKEIAIVENSQLVGSRKKYSFSHAEVSDKFILRVREVEKGDSGRYFCAEGDSLVKQFYLNVLYPPTSLPNCSSSYGAMPSFFDDALQENFQFICSIEEDGNPPIDFVLFKEGTVRVRLAPDGVTEINDKSHHSQRITKFSSYLNSSFNNSHFTCNVFQNMPPALMEYGFNETCSYGPMTLLPTFDISITPSIISVRQGNVSRITCNSNVSDVEKRWLSIGRDLVHNIEEDENGIHLSVFEMKGVEKTTVVCELSYGHRRLSGKATLYKVQNESNKGSSSSVILVSSLLCVLLILILLSFCCYKYREKLRSHISSFYTRPVQTESNQLGNTGSSCGATALGELSHTPSRDN